MDSRENILLIRLKSMGDILFTLPAVHAVRENFPDARLHFLVSQEYTEMLRGFSEIDEIIPLNRALFHSKNLPALCRETVSFLFLLRQKKFSRAIDFQGYSETEMLAWWSGAPERWGQVYRPLRGWTYTRSLSRLHATHPAEQNLTLLQRCGLRVQKISNQYNLPAEAATQARQFFAANNLQIGKPTLFLQPFTSAARKNWPLENYLTLAQHYHSQGVQIIFGGGPSECHALESARSYNFCVAAGASLAISAGLMNFSTLIVGGDTGLLHLATAMGRRTVMLIHGNQPGYSHPFQRANWTILPPAKKTVPEIQTHAVIEACAQAFSEPICNVSC
ncbi:MAG TPA: glycosyltransferase family 9 protein [Verrucomicrobiae bacterium]|nr:glycosyltransferase family 9 protein [Verrucomicrobiae bacterium]